VAIVIPDFVGVIDPRTMLPNFKRELLMFDKIAIPYIHYLRDFYSSNNSEHGELGAELEFLENQGIVIGPVISDSKDPRQCTILRVEGEEDVVFQGAGNPVEMYEIAPRRPLTAEVAHQRAWNIFLTARSAAAALRLLGAGEAVAILPANRNNIFAKEGGKTVVLNIVMSAIPQPSEQTSIQQILDFRADDDVRRAFARLRVWMSEVSRGELTHAEIAEKLESAILEYEHYMQVHRMKTTRGRLQAIVITTAQVAENLATFKWSSALKMLFDIHAQNLELILCEQSAPGREIAYLSMVRQKGFGMS
jgi:hypothetical protein